MVPSGTVQGWAGQNIRKGRDGNHLTVISVFWDHANFYTFNNNKIVKKINKDGGKKLNCTD